MDMNKREYAQVNKNWLTAKAQEEGVKPLPKGIYYKVLAEGKADGKHLFHLFSELLVKRFLAQRTDDKKYLLHYMSKLEMYRSCKLISILQPFYMTEGYTASDEPSACRPTLLSPKTGCRHCPDSWPHRVMLSLVP